MLLAFCIMAAFAVGLLGGDLLNRSYFIRRDRELEEHCKQQAAALQRAASAFRNQVEFCIVPAHCCPSVIKLAEVMESAMDGSITSSAPAQVAAA